MPLLCSRLLLPLLLLSLSAAAQTPAPAPLLPARLGAVQAQGAVTEQTGAGATAVDPAQAALLREDGLRSSAVANYPGLAVRLLRMGDATGAYAAFTAYRHALPQGSLHEERLGAEGVSAGKQYIFRSGNTVVLATAEQAGAPALRLLVALAAALPPQQGPSAVPPPLPGYLPERGLLRESVSYAEGPAGYSSIGPGPLPEAVIDFARDAEVVLASYHARAGLGAVTLLGYPTPQIAGVRERAISKLLASGGTSLRLGDPSVVLRRVGPMLVLTSGAFAADEAKAVALAVHDEGTVTINHPEGYVPEVAKAARLLLGIAYLIGILAVAAVLLAVFLGGGRALVRRLRGKPASSVSDDEFITLHIGSQGD